MTEYDRNCGNDVAPLLASLEGTASIRKLAVFVANCLLRLSRFRVGADFRPQIDLSNSFLDGALPDEQFLMRILLWIGHESATVEFAWSVSEFVAHQFYLMSMQGFYSVGRSPKYDAVRNEERKRHAILVREIFGNPIRPVTLEPRWLTSTVLELARTIYDERVPERMPILADALMDAGCDSEDILNHCREPGPHVRGCWVVDLLLGKS